MSQTALRHLGLAGAELRHIPVDRIDADPDQPRTDFDPAGIRALRASVGQVGLIQPLVVEEQPDGRYRVVAGERRLRAMKLGAAEDPRNPHFRKAPAVVFPAGSVPAWRKSAWQLTENLQRRNLTPGETARGLRAARQALALADAERLARSYGALPDAFDPSAAPERQEAALRPALARVNVPWPEPGWDRVMQALGLDLTGGTYARVRQILGLADPVLDRCDALGLTRSAAAAVAAIPGEERQLALLDAVRDAADPSLATPAAELLAADPDLQPADAVAAVQAARRAAEAGRDRRCGPPAGQLTLPKPACPPAEFERVADHLRSAAATLELYRLVPYQAGSVRLLLERLRTASKVDQAADHVVGPGDRRLTGTGAAAS